MSKALTFPFNKDSFKVEYIGLIALSKATVDPRVTFIDSTGATVKMAIPTSIARIVRTKLKNVTRFAEAYPACLAFIDGRIISMDVALEKNYKMYREFGEWISVLERRSAMFNALDDTWLWDGQYAYKEQGPVAPLGESGFGTVPTRALNSYRLGEEKTDLYEDMAGLCFKHPTTKEWIKTSPMTRQSGGFIQLIGEAGATSNKSQYINQDDHFDLIDNQTFVNLRFVNYAARSLSNAFGYESVEPLGLPLLMIEHRTFNVGGLSLPVQMTSPAPMKFTRALAWMIGMYLNIRTLSDLIVVKQTFKMLLTKGCTANNMIAAGDKEESSTMDVISRLRLKMESAELIDFDEEDR